MIRRPLPDIEMLPRIRTSTLIGLAALAFWGGAIPYAVNSAFDGDPRGLLRLGSAFQHPPALAGAPIFEGDGYDGQFFAALATDPLLLRPETRLMFDAPAYRAGRIGLPLAAWLLAAGNGSVAIFLYQVLSWGLGALVVWVVARWLEDEGHSPWWAAPLICSGGVLSSFMGSMPDVAAMTLATAALWRSATRRRGAVPLLVAAVLVRETSIIAALAIAAAELRQRRFRPAALVVGAPALTLLAWRAYVVARFGADSMDVPGGNLALPLTWLPEKLAQTFDAPEVLAMLGLALAFAGLLVLLPSVARWSVAETSYAGFAVMGLLLSRLNYVVIWWGYTRSLLPLAVLSVIVAARTTGWRRWWFRAIPLAWAAVGAVMLPRWVAGLAVALCAIALYGSLSLRALERSRTVKS
jgi:hypothetical protein